MRKVALVASSPSAADIRVAELERRMAAELAERDAELAALKKHGGGGFVGDGSSEYESLNVLLASLGVEKYSSLFIDEEIDLEILKMMGESDLSEIGIPKGPRLKILRAIAGYITPSNTPSAAEPEITGFNECILCLDGPRTIFVMSCEHLCLCKKCSLKKFVTNCPVCSTYIESKNDIVPT